jgi:hypothetical protein
VFIIEVIVGSGFLVDVKTFYGIWMEAFLLKLWYLHDIMNDTKGMHVLI